MKASPAQAAYVCKYLTVFIFMLPSFLGAQQLFKLDDSFGQEGKVVLPIATYENGASSDVDHSYQIGQQSDGKIILAGYSSDTSAVQRYVLTVVRLHTNGDLDESFGKDGIARVDFGDHEDEGWAVAVQADDKILVTGRIWERPYTKMGIVRFTPDGRLDYSFGNLGKVLHEVGQTSDEGFDLEIQPDGKILAVGRAWGINGVTGWACMRLLPDGELDPSFNLTGKFYFNSGFWDESAFCVKLQPDGKILLGGSIAYNPAIIRLLPNGRFDTTFHGDGIYTTEFPGIVTSLNVDDSARIVFSAYAQNGYCQTGRVLPDGTPDDTFGEAGNAIFNTDQNLVQNSYYTSYDRIILLPDGNMVGLGSFQNHWDYGITKYLTLLLMDENGNVLESLLSRPNMQFLLCKYGIWNVDAILLQDGSIGITSFYCASEIGTDMLAAKLLYTPNDTLPDVPETGPPNPEFSVYPNPSTGQIVIEKLDPYLTMDLTIYDSRGRMVFHTMIDQAELEISLEAGAGLYFIRVQDLVKKLVLIK